MNYTIRSGDTLSKVASRHGTSLAALMQANPSITNPNRIYAGQKLVIPGSRDEFVPARPAAGKDPLALARSVLGQNVSSLKVSSGAIGKTMHDGVPNNVNCANFASACLEVAGRINKSQHSNSVRGLMANLDRDPDFRRVSLQNARPGDVVSMKVGSGQHQVLFAGWQNGKPMYIGANNANRDGSQRVTLTTMNYPILSVHHYVGR